MRRLHLLNHAAGVCLHREVKHLALHLLRKDPLLRLVAVIEELLHHIVSEDILHQLHRIRLDLSEDLVLLVAIRSLQLLLNESRTVLVAAELDYVVVDIPELEPLA